MTARIGDAIGQSGAWIIDFQMFSNKQTAIRFEVPGDHVEALHRNLKATGLTLDAESEDKLRRTAATAAGSSDIPGTLRITFIHNDPDLRQTIPAIPG